MSIVYLRPGVYIEEIYLRQEDLLAAPRQAPALEPGWYKRTRPIGTVAKTVTAFLGITAEASNKAGDPATGERAAVENRSNKATLISNWTQFLNTFGDFIPGAFLPEAVYGHFANGGGPCYVTSLRALSEGPDTRSGGGFSPLEYSEISGEAAERTGLAGLEVLDDVNLIACPDAMAGYDGSAEARERVKAIQWALVAHCERMHTPFAILDTPPGLSAQQVYEWRQYLDVDSSYAALYYPWIQVANLSGSGGATQLVPPSGHISGIFARSDTEQGIHKTPAGEVVRGATGLELALSDSEQDILNPIGINVLRYFTDRGIRIWGARTLSSDGAWRAVRVRRFMSWIEGCIERGLQWAVTETLEPRLFARIERQISEFLTLVWRSQALPGENPEEAFSVRCDETTTPVEARQRGLIIAEVVLTMHDGLPRSFRVLINTMM